MSDVRKLVFPWGGCGNHLRWLLSFDKEFDYVKLWNTKDNSPDTKLNFILDNVYNSSRSWNSWLDREWQYRPAMENILRIWHQFDFLQLEEQDLKKVLVLDYEDFVPLWEHYFHINLGTNSNNPYAKVFLKGNGWAKGVNQIKSQTAIDYKIVDGSLLFEKNLDRAWLQNIADYLEFDLYYDHAEILHKRYMILKDKSARDFYEYFTGPEFSKFLDIMNIRGQQNDNSLDNK
jgi:hypothetical protein